VQPAAVGAEADPEPARAAATVKAETNAEKCLCRINTPFRWGDHRVSPVASQAIEVMYPGVGIDLLED
jgi:hypothetical protein